MLERLGTWSFHHRWRTLLGWLVLAVALTAAAGAFQQEFADGGRLRGTDSDQAYDLLGREFPDGGGDRAVVVFEVPAGVTDPTAAAAIGAYLDDVSSLPGIAEVLSPLDAPAQVAPSGTIAYATIEVAAGEDGDAFAPTAAELERRAEALSASGVRAEFDGDWFTEGGVPSTELLGILAAAVILLISFGSVLAMGLPLITALVGVAIAMAGVGLWTVAVPTPDFTVEVATMIGIGVGIDYALFIITRYRTALADQAPADAIRTTMGTAGRAVVFAGGTVMISLLGMLLMGLEFLRGLALGTSTAVLVSVLAAVTLLPALLSLVTKRLSKVAARVARRPSRESLWHRWSRLVQRRPVVMATAATTVLLLAAAPVLGMRLAVADEGNDRPGSTTRESYDLLAEGFGPGANGPLVVVATMQDAAAQADVAALHDAVAATAGVASVGPVVPSPRGAAALFAVIPTTAPQDAATSELVRRLRDDVIPGFERAGAVEAHVGGGTASDVDFAQLMSSRLPIFIGAVLVLSFGLLLLTFRSLLVPLKAVVMNLLSIGAAYGVMVAVFQWGWGAGLIGTAGGAPIEPWAPMMLFAIVFGLSMDYEVFLLSAMKERYDATGDNRHAVVEGLASTARVITAAAAIMVFVFGSFVFGDMRAIKVIGLGLATAVLIDATVVRMVLVPATMELLGDRNWWLPRWLDRLLPTIRVEREQSAAAEARPLESVGGVR